jgi:hypothetical protein
VGSADVLFLALTGVAALTLAAVGYRIRFWGDVWLVAGYDPDRVTDEAGLARLVGTAVLGLAALTVAVGVADTFVLASTGVLWTGYTLAVCVVAGSLVWASDRYTSDT